MTAAELVELYWERANQPGDEPLYVPYPEWQVIYHSLHEALGHWPVAGPKHGGLLLFGREWCVGDKVSRETNLAAMRVAFNPPRPPFEETTR